MALGGEIPGKGLFNQLKMPCCTLGRWSAEHGPDGEEAFPGSGNPVANKDYEILKLKKESKELCKEEQLWYGDITYTPTREQWLYLATYLDLLSRKIIGWQASSHIDENLVIDALDNTANRENPEEELIVRTNSGSQYTSSRFCREFEGRGFVQSFSRKGRHYDNAVIELFFKTLKRELPPRSQV